MVGVGIYPIPLLFSIKILSLFIYLFIYLFFKFPLISAAQYLGTIQLEGSFGKYVRFLSPY